VPAIGVKPCHRLGDAVPFDQRDHLLHVAGPSSCPVLATETRASGKTACLGAFQPEEATVCKSQRLNGESKGMECLPFRRFPRKSLSEGELAVARRHSPIKAPISYDPRRAPGVSGVTTNLDPSKTLPPRCEVRRA
jgi:hypothetical protein